MRTIVLLLFLAFSGIGFAQQLVYTPVNPAFGGDPFNYTWLLNSANSQNPFQDDQLDLNSLGGLGGLNQFGQFGQFGAEMPPLGTSRDGNFEYEVFESTEGLVINVLDITTGEQTQIIVPNG